MISSSGEPEPPARGRLALRGKGRELPVHLAKGPPPLDASAAQQRVWRRFVRFFFIGLMVICLVRPLPSRVCGARRPLEAATSWRILKRPHRFDFGPGAVATFPSLGTSCRGVVPPQSVLVARAFPTPSRVGPLTMNRPRPPTIHSPHPTVFSSFFSRESCRSLPGGPSDHTRIPRSASFSSSAPRSASWIIPS